MIAQGLLEVTIAIYSFKSTDDLYLQASQKLLRYVWLNSLQLSLSDLSFGLVPINEEGEFKHQKAQKNFPSPRW